MAVLLVTVAAYPFLICNNCRNSVSVTQKAGASRELDIWFLPFPESVAAGGTATRTLNLAKGALGGPDHATVRYFPPLGAGNVTFSGRQPANPDGPPPFVFNGVPTDGSGSVEASYSAPSLPDHAVAAEAKDHWEVTTPSGSVYSATTYQNVYTRTSPPPAGAPAMTAPAARVRVRPPAAAGADTYEWWVAQLVAGLDGRSMTTDLCREIFTYLQSGSFFIAMRLPYDASDPADSIVTRYGDPGWFPRVELVNVTVLPMTVASVPMERNQHWTAYAESHLPGAKGERWTALVPSPSPAAVCPDGMSLPFWRLVAPVLLDAGPDRAAWNGRVLTGYFGLVGSQPPPVLPTIASSLANVLARAGGDPAVTTLGPFPIHFDAEPPTPPIIVVGPQVGWVDPPQRVERAFVLENLTGAEESATLTLESRFTIPWAL